jgi:hypothetical protein
MHMMSPITDDAAALRQLHALRHAMAQLGAVNASFFSTIFV